MTVQLLLDMAAFGFEDRVAIGPLDTGITFDSLRERALRGASLIARESPANVAFVGRNGPAYSQVFCSAVMAGVPFAPLNYRLSEDQLNGLIDDLGDSMIIADEEYVSALGDRPVTTTTAFLAAATTTDLSDPVDVTDSSIAVLLFTSGTTARPKAVVLKHGNLASYILSTVEFGSASPEDAALITVPPYHVAAIGSTLSNLYSGRRVVHLPDFDAGKWLALARTENITSAMLVPTMLSRVVDVIGEGPAELPNLRLISYGGARMPRPLIEQALTRLPAVDFVNAYGLTETSSTIALLGAAEHREAITSSDPLLRARLASVGRLVPGVESQIRDDSGRPVAAGEIGLLWVRGDQVSGEYVGRASGLDADGWFLTKDLARQDADGYLYIEGRADDTIIRGGENISPAEIEDVLVLHPGVRDVAVIGIPDDEWGEKICAVVVREASSDVSTDDIQAFVRQRLRGSRTPDVVVWRDSLPQTDTGKLLRWQLVSEFS